MKRNDSIRILKWAGLLLLAALLVGGCAKKEIVPPEPPPPPPVVEPDTTGQAALEAAERAAAEKARQDSIAQEQEAEQQWAKVSLQIVYFDFDKYDLRPDASEAANFDAGVLEEYADWQVLIEGHCDERGTVEYNLALGERRATTVKTFFINYGLAANRFSIISYGEERPADPGHNEDAWAKNRRAVLVIR